MIKSAKIERFRCFENVSLPDCRTLNVIVGKNASGKTALLESVFLAAGPSPEVALRLRAWRGYDSPMISGTLEQIDDAIWRPFFFKYDVEKEVKITLKGSDDHTRSLEMNWGTVDHKIVSITGNQIPSGKSAITFKWTRFDRTEFSINPEFGPGGYSFPGTEQKAIPAVFFVASHPFPNGDNLRRFSELSVTRRDKAFAQAIKKEFHFIDGIDIQSHAGASMLHADIPYLPQKIPLVAVSSGINKLVSILLALSEEEKNILCIDEIDNGIHYSRLENMWHSMHFLAKENGAQVFASTHSAECLMALAKACAHCPEDVTVIRTEMEDGKTVLEQFRGETIFKSIRAGEVR